MSWPLVRRDFLSPSLISLPDNKRAMMMEMRDPGNTHTHTKARVMKRQLTPAAMLYNIQSSELSWAELRRQQQQSFGMLFFLPPLSLLITKKEDDGTCWLFGNSWERRRRPGRGWHPAMRSQRERRGIPDFNGHTSHPTFLSSTYPLLLLLLLFLLLLLLHLRRFYTFLEEGRMLRIFFLVY